MTDLVLESIRVVIVGAFGGFLFLRVRSHPIAHLPGSRLVLLGFLLLFLGMLVDVSDNFPQLSRFVLLGDTRAEAFIEKAVGSLLGYAFVGLGLVRMVPAWLEHDRRTRERLDTATHDLKQLGDLVPICSYCKKIRDDDGYWNQVEQYIDRHSDVRLTHGMCPTCYDDVLEKEKQLLGDDLGDVGTGTNGPAG